MISQPEKRWGHVVFSSLGCAFLLLGVALLFDSCRQNKPPRPNILIISVDTLRADRLGCYGYAGGLTPNVDALAKDGIVFERGVAQDNAVLRQRVHVGSE